MKEEIVASLQNAVARGESIEQAIQTMITAGYPATEVQDSARYINMGIIGRASPNPQQPPSPSATQQPLQQPVQQQVIQAPQTQPPQKKKKNMLKVVILILIFIVLIIILTMVFFGNQIMQLIFKPAAQSILALLD